MQKLIILTVTLLLNMSCAFAAPTEITVEGMYLRYEGGEYQSALTPCGSFDIWRVEEKGEAYLDLLKQYKTLTHSKYGEIYIKAKGRLLPIDKGLFPDTHYSSTFTLKELLLYSSGNESPLSCKP